MDDLDTDQVIFIGLDGLGFNEIDDWLDGGDLPNLAQLIEDGSSGNLTSTTPPWTPVAWPSMLTGQNPGKHGVFDFFTRDGYEKSLVDRDDVRSPYLWDVLSAEGKTPVVVNFPITHPLSNLERGAVVPGYLAPEDVSFSPVGLRDEYQQEYGTYRIYPDYGDDANPEEYLSVARNRRNMARFLDQRYEWDLLAVQFQVTDSIFHDLNDPEQIRQVLTKVDEFVGDILELGDDDTDVFIASDHGMGDYEWTFYVNAWLSENGYCEITTGEEQYFRQAKDELKSEGDDEKPPNVTSAVKTVVNALSAVGLSPRRIHCVLGTVGLDKTAERLLPEEALVAAQNQVVDHENSIAYQLLFNSLGVHLNVKERDPNGRVSPKRYDDVREELIEELSQIRDPDGNILFDEVLPCEEIYEGPHLEDAPDIILVPRDYQYDVSGSIVDTFRRYPHKNHRPKGILISNRDLDISSGQKASIYDVTPTLAAALGIPVDTETDGEVLGSLNANERADWDDLASEYREATGFDSRPTDNVEERLADLGYLE